MYYIVNRVTPRRGPPLALTLSGDNMPAVISGKTMSLTQQVCGECQPPYRLSDVFFSGSSPISTAMDRPSCLPLTRL